MVTFPNAKINLGLNIVSRRPDGYHDIATVMMPVGWTDILEIVPGKGPDSTLTVTGRGVDCPPEKNLVMRACRAVCERYPQVQPVDIFLHKVIPDGAGMGGGSADAAFTISTLNSMFGLGMTPSEMAEVAAGIGADCPFFIYNRPMLCTGTGTTMEPFDSLAIPEGTVLVIAKPQEGVSTRQAYAGVTPREAVPPVAEAAAMPWTRWQEVLHNDFESSVMAACPSIAEVKRTLMAYGPVYCSMSGSGSAVYALFAPGSANMSELEKSVRAQLPGCDVFVEQR